MGGESDEGSWREGCDLASSRNVDVARNDGVARDRPMARRKLASTAARGLRSQPVRATPACEIRWINEPEVGWMTVRFRICSINFLVLPVSFKRLPCCWKRKLLWSCA